jgi:hypothetical protein
MRDYPNCAYLWISTVRRRQRAIHPVLGSERRYLGSGNGMILEVTKECAREFIGVILAEAEALEELRFRPPHGMRVGEQVVGDLRGIDRRLIAVGTVIESGPA